MPQLGRRRGAHLYSTLSFQRNLCPVWLGGMAVMARLHCSCGWSADGLDRATRQVVSCKKKVKGAMPQLGRRRGAHLPLAAVEPVGG